MWVRSVCRILVILLNLAAAGLMIETVSRVIGPDNSIPPRGPRFTICYLAFHAGPAVGLAALAAGSPWVGSRSLPYSLFVLTLMVILPGIQVARDEAVSRPDGFAPLYGAITFLVACGEYLVVTTTGAVVLIAWRVRVRRQPPGQST